MTLETPCIYTAKYLVTGNAPPLEAGAFLVNGGKIVELGSIAALKGGHSGIKVVDFGDTILTPLLVNAHTHLELTNFPQWAATAGEGETPASFVDWIVRMIRVKRKLTAEDYRDSLLHGINQSIAAGTGAVGDIIAHHGARNQYCDSSLLGTLFLETLGQDPELICRLKEGLAQALQDEVCGLIKLGVSPHSPYTISKDYLASIYRKCRELKLRCSTHLAESADEVEFVEHGRGNIASHLYPYIGWESYVPQATGLRPVEYLLQQGGLFPENLLVHGVHLNQAEIELLAQKQMSLVLCPRSNALLNVGTAPAGKLLQAGVKLSLGTDSLASCDSLSIWDEMAFAHTWFAGELDAPTLFTLATSGGAEALGLQTEIGSLAPGKVASFQVLQPQTTVAPNEIFDYFVSSPCSADIKHVYLQGILQ